MKLAVIFAATLFMSSAAEAACKTWDLNCDPNTGGRSWDLNAKNKQQRNSIRTGQGSWDLNTDRGGSKRWDLNSRNGCKTWDLNCK